VLRRDQRASPDDAATLAQIVSAIMFLSMAATINISRSVDEILSEISGLVSVLLPTRGTHRTMN
jgi:TetR/AcrR family transcriptional regulator